MRNYIFAALTIIAVASCAKKTTPTTAKNDDPVTLFGANCAKCHGANGMEGKAPKLNTVMSDSQVKDYITNGHGHMPAFKDKLSPKEIDAITGLTIKLQRKNSGK